MRAYVDTCAIIYAIEAAADFATQSCGNSPQWNTTPVVYLATAIEVGADFFLTGDADLRRCADIPVKVVNSSP
jgi:hypothetical protein